MSLRDSLACWAGLFLATSSELILTTSSYKGYAQVLVPKGGVQ